MTGQDLIIEKTRDLPPEFFREVLDFIDFLREKRKKEIIKAERKKAIAEFAKEHAGTSFDLDCELEQAGIEHLLDEVKN